ncbi:hypothetical protein UCRPC4_g02280 [Phaeomoniella chlamydospora]|uniref:Outer spore wall protein RRT8 n=1 Tax=Phaeomoniella chlamydospora TaxID=158046 RepID=A0A0G2ERG1_PHACM|nr:hypothetical protein UCRPC4_g02280 [Phaeomoniella chlamydospora]
MTDKVREVAVEEAENIKILTTQAVKSRAYIYPIHGLYYFVSHKSLWKPLGSKLAPTITLAIGVTTVMFLVAYVPQAAVLAFTNGPVAAISAALLTLSESSTIANLLARTFLIEDALIDTFDGTLVSRECTSLVSDGREIKSGKDPIAKLGKLVKKPFAKFTPKALIRYLMYLPLNFIPVVGTFIFVLLQGKRYGPNAHARYFQLKEWSKSQKDAFVEQNRAAYTSYGVVAALLEMVPIASIFFSFTNTVGAALWAADLEAKASTAPNLRDAAKKVQ